MREAALDADRVLGECRLEVKAAEADAARLEREKKDALDRLDAMKVCLRRFQRPCIRLLESAHLSLGDPVCAPEEWRKVPTIPLDDLVCAPEN